MANEKKKSASYSSGDRSRPAPTRRSQLPDITFLNVELGEAEKSACNHWINANPPLAEIVDGLLSEGYKLSHSVDMRSGAHMATLTDRREGSQHANHCITLRGRDYLTALYRLCWVHSVHLDGDWESVGQRNSSGDVW